MKGAMANVIQVAGPAMIQTLNRTHPSTEMDFTALAGPRKPQTRHVMGGKGFGGGAFACFNASLTTSTTTKARTTMIPKKMITMGVGMRGTSAR
jgi:hypothetical protein